MSTPDDYRAASHERWSAAAGGWSRQREAFQRAVMPVSTWMVDAIAPQPGERVLELAAGPGDTGLLAAEIVLPGGTLVSSDFAEAMLDAARARAAELGIGNVEFRAIDAEWIDLPPASVDAVLCRWGYMVMADPAAALRETRRVLKPGGRLALAAWAAPEENPNAATPFLELRERGLVEPPAPGSPDMFAFAADGVLDGLLAGAGFVEWTIEPVGLTFRYDALEDWWDMALDLSQPLYRLVAGLDPGGQAELLEALAERLAPFRSADGSLTIPGRALLAAASA